MVKNKICWYEIYIIFKLHFPPKLVLLKKTPQNNYLNFDAVSPLIVSGKYNDNTCLETVLYFNVKTLNFNIFFKKFLRFGGLRI